MKHIRYISRLTNHPRLAFGVLAIFYALLILLLPANTITMQTYNLSSLEYRIISFAIALPSIIVWLTAFIGYEKLYEYAQAITKTSEGDSFLSLARGVKWLAWSLPVPVIAATILNAMADQWPDFRPTAIILGNYLGLLLLLIAFTIIANASRSLVTRAGIKFDAMSIRLITLCFVTAGVLFCYFTFSKFDLASIHDSNNPYYLPMWLMVLTVVIPYLYSWFLGLLAAYEISLFGKHVRGLLYKQGLRCLVFGLVGVIISAIALQYISGVSPRVGYLALNVKLALMLLFRVVGGVGFVLITIGALRLKKIEDI